MKRAIRKLLASVLCVCMLFSTFIVTASASNPAIIIGNNDYNKVISQKNYAIAPGISEARIILNDDTGNNQNMAYVMEVDLSNPYATVLPAYKDMDPYCDGTQGLSKMAQAAENKLGVNVVGGTNIYLTWANNIPAGVLVINGEVYYNDYSTSYGYLAIMKDGRAEFRDGRTPLTGDEWQAMTVCSYIVKNGKSLFPEPDHDNVNRAPRTTIGMKADGTLVMAVVDGRQAPASVGMTMHELAQMMIDLGCVTAFNCDGGGSSTFISEREGSGQLTIKNSPSDGVERPTLTSLLVVSTATPSGVFDHATLSPNGDFYTPGSEIQFTAVGVDSAGGSAPLPADIKWRLAADSLGIGSIDESTGLFTGNPGQTGTVAVELISNGAVIGTSSIEVVVPDTISFHNSDVSLDFGATTNFELIVKYQGLDVIYKDSDIVWTMSDPRLGTFSGSLFTASDNETVSGTITAAYAGDETINSTISVVVGMLPIVVLDFEDYVDPDTGEVTPAKEYYTIDQGPGSKFVTANYNAGGKQSAEIVSIDDDEPVRLGRYSMKLNYDFTNCGAVTEGAELGFSEDVEVPGMPTGIGVWVYAPEGTGIKWGGDGTTAGFWLRCYLLNKNGVVEQANFTLEPKAVTGDQQPGIYWEGWKYCEADLTQLKNGPYRLQAGKTFRLMYVHGIKMGTKTAGSIYFDNLQFVYGTNVDDLDKPVINQRRAIIEGIDTEFIDGMTIPSNTIDQFMFTFYDVQNKYTSGVNAETARIFIDGVNICSDSYYNTYIDPNGAIYAYGLTLQNGRHTITVSIRDKAGNEQTETYTFFIQGEGLDIPAISVEPVESSAKLGGEVNLNINASTDTVDQCSIGVKLSSLFPDYAVEFADGYEGTYSYNKLTKTLVINAARRADAAPGITEVANISVAVPTTLKLGNEFTYTVVSCGYTVGGSKHTWSQETRILPVDAAYHLAIEPIILGLPGYITVTESGTPAVDVGIYLDNGTLIGATDENGVLSTNYFSATAGEYSVYAKDESGRLSFQYKVYSYVPQGDASGLPFGIMNNASANGSTQKNISWFSSPVAAAQQKLQYTIGDSEDWIDVDAVTVNRTFTRDGYSIVAVNNVTLTNLTPGTTYRYRVGADGVWSDVRSFTTCDTSGTDFFVVADVQTKDLTQITQLIQTINAQGFDFGIQTGDAVENAASYGDWMDIVALFGVDALTDTDVVHVLGNHEYAGDATAAAAVSIFGLPQEGVGTYYSVTYGDVYVAAINYTSTKAELAEALEWLKRDAAGSKAPWKILVMHQPPYYTNISGGNAEINAMVPDAVEEAGIDFVFSGHDHAYARTMPLRDGMIDERNGVVYFICGSTGEKSYTITDNPDFHFAKLIGDYGSVYLSVSADKTSCRISVIESGTYNGEIDSYEKHVVYCEDGDHQYSYDKASDILTCSVCTYECDASDTMYAGWASDTITGKTMHFIGGKYVTGYQYIEAVPYYFDANGLAYEGEFTIGGETCLFEEGKYISCSTANILTAGWCGANVEFVVYANGTIILSGYGPMYSYTIQATVPWSAFSREIRRVLVGSEITTIGKYAFSNAYYIEAVEFAADSKLQKIEGNGFNYILNLRTVTLPESLKELDYRAFAKNRALERMYIPASVTTIHDLAFEDFNPDLVLQVADGSVAHKYAVAKGIKVEVREYVPRVVDSGACGASAIWTLYDNDTLEISGSGDMTNYATREQVPWDAYKPTVKKVVIGPDITSVGSNAFCHMYNLTNITFAEESKVASLGNHAFHYVSKVTSVTLPDSVKTLGYSSLGYCANLTSVYLPDGLTNINDMAFWNHNANLKLSVAAGSPAHLFAESKGIAVNVRGEMPDPNAPLYEGACGVNATWAIYRDGRFVVSGSGDMTDYATREEAPWNAYRSSIKSVIIGADITSVGSNAFCHMYNLENITFEGSKVTSLGNHAFHYALKVTSVILPESVRSLGYSALGYCANLTSVYLPDGLTNINAKAFWNPNPNLVLSVAAGGPAHLFAEINGISVDVRGEIPDPDVPLYEGTCGENAAWAIYRDGRLVVSGSGDMTDYATREEAPWNTYRSNIVTVIIGADITSVGSNAFCHMYNLENIIFEEGSKVVSLGNHAFHYALKVTSVILPDSVKTLGYSALGYCANLTSVYLPDGLENINAKAFWNPNANLTLSVAADSVAHQFAVAQGIKVAVR